MTSIEEHPHKVRKGGIKSDERLKKFYLKIKQSTKGEKKAIIALARKSVVYA